MDADLRVNALYLSSRLRSRLADAARCPVTTIIAPTGYGKTTAAQYLQRRIAAEAPDAYLFRQFLSGGGRQEFWAGLCRALHTAPHNTPVRRLDEVGAARNTILRYTFA